LKPGINAAMRGCWIMIKFLAFPFMRWARTLRPATLLKIALALVCVDAVLPELIPFEVLLGIGAMVFSAMSGLRSDKVLEPNHDRVVATIPKSSGR
jgi:hypothetical protein